MTDLPNYDPSKYQVWLYKCPAVFPCFFATHPWFVVNKKGVVSRWEVVTSPNTGSTDYGYLSKDCLPPTTGIRIFPYTMNPRYGNHLIGMVSGDADSLAAQMAAIINDSHKSYPHHDRYVLTGPNSNTYVQWILDQFPESGLKLPWNAFGKNFVA